MFVLAELEDTVCVHPHEFNRGLEETIERRLNIRLANKIVPQLGLCICFYDLLEVGHSALIPGDGSSHTKVKFRYIVFRPFVDEVIEARVVSSSKEGLTLSLEFFEDIFIPASKLPEPHIFEESEQIWHWEYVQEEGEAPAKLYLDPGKVVRFRVVENIFKDVKPDLTVEEAKKEKSYEIIGAMNESGLGCLAWWANQTEEEEVMNEVEEEEKMDTELVVKTELD